MTEETVIFFIPEANFFSTQGTQRHGNDGFPGDGAVHFHARGFQVGQPAEERKTGAELFCPFLPVGNADAHPYHPAVRVKGFDLFSHLGWPAAIIYDKYAAVIA